MADCCEDKSCAIDALQSRQSKTLKIVLVLNAVMFIVELLAGLASASVSLLSDSLDNLGDALTYAISLYAVKKSTHTKAKVGLFKGVLILLAGLFVLGQVAWRFLHPVIPHYEVMGVVSLLALLANGVCFLLLWKHKEEDINMSSVWECSRNDIASNLSVFVAALGVWLTQSAWADLLVGLGLAFLFLRSAINVITNARTELKKTAIQPAAALIIKRQK